MMLACRSSCSSNMAPADASCGTICLAAISDGSIPLPFFNSILNMDCLHPQERLRRKAGAEPPFGKRPYPPPDEVNSRNVNLMGRPNRALDSIKALLHLENHIVWSPQEGPYLGILYTAC